MKKINVERECMEKIFTNLPKQSNLPFVSLSLILARFVSPRRGREERREEETVLKIAGHFSAGENAKLPPSMPLRISGWKKEALPPRF